MLLRLLVLLLAFQTCAGAKDKQRVKEAAEESVAVESEQAEEGQQEAEPVAELWLYCNTTSKCQASPSTRCRLHCCHAALKPDFLLAPLHPCSRAAPSEGSTSIAVH
jgi:hypothetical protein